MDLKVKKKEVNVINNHEHFSPLTKKQKCDS